MAIKISTPTTPSRRHYHYVTTRDLSPVRPKRSLTIKLSGLVGRNNTGRITIRHRGGGHKQLYRVIDFKRDKKDVLGHVRTVEYDPNRTCNIALIVYVDGDQRYIIAPEGLQVGHKIISADAAEINPGNCLSLKNIPIGTPIHNIELRPGKGGQMVRSAGSAAIIQSKEGDFATILLPSKELRLVKLTCFATIGQVSNPDHQNISLGKAGRRRHMGWRPAVRGVAMHPNNHPHGGGEGRSGVGLKHPKTPWGKPAMGKKTRTKKKYSTKYIVRDRRIK